MFTARVNESLKTCEIKRTLIDFRSVHQTSSKRLSVGFWPQINEPNSVFIGGYLWKYRGATVFYINKICEGQYVYGCIGKLYPPMSVLDLTRKQ